MIRWYLILMRLVHFFPLIWSDNTYDGYGISAYIGDYRNGMDGSQEAITSLAAVLSATLLGVDKSAQNLFVP